MKNTPFYEGLLSSQLYSVAHTRNDSLLLGQYSETNFHLKMVILASTSQTSLISFFSLYLDVMSLSAGEVGVM